MHFTRQVIALRAQSRTLQIFDLEAKQKLKSTTMNEDVVFWKWISDTTIGLVTDAAVYHWDVFDANQATPVKQFARNDNLSVSWLDLPSGNRQNQADCFFFLFHLGQPNHQLPR